MHDDIAIGYIEAKDIGVSIRSHRGANKDQFDRYINDLDNLIYTDCLKWDFYLNGNLVRSVSIAEIRGGELKPKPDNFDELADYLLDFLGQRPKTIKTAQELTEYMAKRTHMIRYAFEKSLTSKDADTFIEDLKEQYDAFKQMLVKDISGEKICWICTHKRLLMVCLSHGFIAKNLKYLADKKHQSYYQQPIHFCENYLNSSRQKI